MVDVTWRTWSAGTSRGGTSCGGRRAQGHHVVGHHVVDVESGGRHVVGRHVADVESGDVTWWMQSAYVKRRVVWGGDDTRWNVRPSRGGDVTRWMWSVGTSRGGHGTQEDTQRGRHVVGRYVADVDCGCGSRDRLGHGHHAAGTTCGGT